MATVLNGRIKNALSVDVEDYFHVSAFESRFTREHWDRIPCRVERNVDRVLELMSHAEARATFFTLGWVAERFPQMIRRIVDAGHELASHGYAHQRVTTLNERSFSADLSSSKAILEDISGTHVTGYRAPSFSIGRGNLWAFDCILAAGYRYSSSVYPIRHDHYGMPEAPRFAYRPRDGLWEVPIATARLFRINVPAGGGGYFRLLPYAMSRWLIGRVNRRDGNSVVFYFHPWEIDPTQPRVAGVTARARLRHYINLQRTEQRLSRLLADFAWDRVDRTFSMGTV